MTDYKGALYYLMTEILEYSPDKGENALTKQAHADLLSLIEELEGIKKRATIILGKALEELWQGVEVIPKVFFEKLHEYLKEIDFILTGKGASK